MHSNTLAKIKSDDADDAESEVREAFEDSCTPGNDAGWDFIADFTLINDEELAKLGVTYEELEKEFKGATEAGANHIKGALREEVIHHMIGTWLSSREAPLYIASDDRYVKECAEKTLKESKVVEYPKNFDALVQIVFDTLTKDAGEMLSYYLDKFEKDQVLSTASISELLVNTNVQFVDFGGDGDKTFYFMVDRHS